MVIYCYLVILAHLKQNYGQKVKLAKSVWLLNFPGGPGGSVPGAAEFPNTGTIFSRIFTRSPGGWVRNRIERSIIGTWDGGGCREELNSLKEKKVKKAPQPNL